MASFKEPLIGVDFIMYMQTLIDMVELTGVNLVCSEYGIVAQCKNHQM